MTVFLLDANVLIAMAWTAHDNHEQVQRWLGKNARHGWATCPFTEAAFVRIVCNPAFSRDALTLPESLQLLKANLEHPAHQFWPADLSFPEAVRGFEGLATHQQTTDAYLLGLALHRKGKLATLDRGIRALIPGNQQVENSIELIG